jgi:hypothetical protein
MPIPSVRTEGFYQPDIPPPLEPEEEVEMLFNLYAFGMMKNRNFLQPNQFEKLIEERKISYSPSGELILHPGRYKPENAHRIVDAFMFALYHTWENILIEHLRWCTREEWESKNQEQKAVVMDAVFFIEFEMEVASIPEKLFAILTEDSRQWVRKLANSDMA